MPSFNIDIANSFYNSICFINIFIMVMPHIFIYFLRDESMWVTYGLLNDKFGIIFWIIYVFIEALGMSALIRTIFLWYKNNQRFYDLKQEVEAKNISAATEREKELKTKEEIKDYTYEHNNLKTNVLKISNKVEEKYKLYNEAFYKYIKYNKSKEYDIYREVKINANTNISHNIYDYVLKSKKSSEYIIYEIKIGKFSPVVVNRLKNDFLTLLTSYPLNQYKNSKAEIVYIVDDKQEQIKVVNYYNHNKEYYQEQGAIVILEAYLFEDLTINSMEFNE